MFDCTLDIHLGVEPVSVKHAIAFIQLLSAAKTAENAITWSTEVKFNSFFSTLVILRLVFSAISQILQAS